jgi:hypothetical protein
MFKNNFQSPAITHKSRALQIDLPVLRVCMLSQHSFAYTHTYSRTHTEPWRCLNNRCNLPKACSTFVKSTFSRDAVGKRLKELLRC